MQKLLAIFLSVLILGSASNQGQLAFQFGNNLASLTRSDNTYKGLVNVVCLGGVGQLNYSLSGLPNGWSSSGNQITIPNIVNTVGSYVIKARVTDSAGNVIQGDIRLVINGVNVVIQSANNNTINNIQYSLSGTTGSTGSTGTNPNSLDAILNGLLNPSGTGSNPSGTGSNPSGNGNNGQPGTGNNGNNGNNGQPGTGNNGQPGTGNNGQPSGTTQPQNPVSNLYNNYPGLPSGSNITPQNGVNYPVPASPSGTPSTPNIVPSVIANAQAPYNATRDQRTITPDEVKRNAAFNRQLNANKAVANLISIIQQLTANVNAAKNDIGVLENQLRDATNANNACNDQIYDLANNRTKIQNAIKDRQDKISEANSKINALTPAIKGLNDARDNLITKRTELEKSRSPSSDKLKDLENQLGNCHNTTKGLQGQVDDLNNQINTVQDNITKTQQDSANAPSSVAQINQQIPIVDARIADLQKQLNDANAEKQGLLNDRNRYQNLITNAPSIIRGLENTLNGLKNRLPALQSQIDANKARCDAIQNQMDNLRNDISRTEADYKILVEQIKTQDGLIKDKEDEIKKLRDGIAGLPTEIAALQQELARVEDTIKRQFYICNDAADAVRKAKQNLDAMNNKYNTESQWLKDANNNLEKARAEKELADLGVQEIIASSTSALPFSIVPNGNGNTPARTPAGNNPSGSPLGAIPERNEVAPGSPVVVGDLNSYLSQAYGAGVDPTKPSTVTSLYPLSALTVQALTGQSTSGVFNPDGSFTAGSQNGAISGPAVFPGTGVPVRTTGTGVPSTTGLSNFSCNGQSGLTQGYGVVSTVQPGQIILTLQNGNKLALNIAGCSNLNAVKQNYSIVPQTPVYFKGVQTTNGVNLQQLTCV